ncbi:MAG: TerC family protein [Burkholderiaceae bacterium]|jgi:YjbE family integral membrane protein|nr:TerC family protein [Gemmatimonadales bacterium]MCO5122074.1 TerC family protein [Burkholderiaceae bacterium]MEB2320666.1 TerC family protein [Pseudomonadota bacterium]
MLEFLTTIDWAAVGQIILIDLLLGGDNAVVIALACRKLPHHLQWKGIMWGTAGAIILRVILIMFAVFLLQVPFLKVVGGVLLLWIGVKLLVPDEDHHADIDGGTGLMSAIRTIIVADLVMSVDNVIAIAAAAEQSSNADHQMGLVIFGLLVSVPIIVWGSRIVLRIIERHPIVIWFGGALLGWIAGGMIVTDRIVHDWIGPQHDMVPTIASIIGALFVIALGKWLLARRARAASLREAVDTGPAGEAGSDTP